MRPKAHEHAHEIPKSMNEKFEKYKILLASCQNCELCKE